METVLKPISVAELNESDDFFIESVYFDSEGLVVILRLAGNDQQNLVRFQDFVSYNLTEESYLLKYWGNLPVEQTKHLFYEVENSPYQNLFDDLSLGIYQDSGIKHYAIYTDHLCLDVLSRSRPVFSTQ